jgi:hypothetical protein
MLVNANAPLAAQPTPSPANAQVFHVLITVQALDGIFVRPFAEHIDMLFQPMLQGCQRTAPHGPLHCTQVGALGKVSRHRLLHHGSVVVVLVGGGPKQKGAQPGSHFHLRPCQSHQPARRPAPLGGKQETYRFTMVGGREEQHHFRESKAVQAQRHLFDLSGKFFVRSGTVRVMAMRRMRVAGGNGVVVGEHPAQQSQEQHDDPLFLLLLFRALGRFVRVVVLKVGNQVAKALLNVNVNGHQASLAPWLGHLDHACPFAGAIFQAQLTGDAIAMLVTDELFADQMNQVPATFA